MKSKEVQKVVKTKYENGDGPAKTYRDLAGAVSLSAFKLWIKIINTTVRHLFQTVYARSVQSRYCQG